MRALFMLWGVFALSVSALAQPPDERSALVRDNTGWLDLLPGNKLSGWKRVPIPPDDKLIAKNPWSVDEANKVLVCDGVGVKEMLLYDKPFADGIFHVEWRFRPVKDMDMPIYNSGIYVRTDAKGTHWHQAQVAHTVKPPFMGDLFGKTRRAAEIADFLVRGKGQERIKGPGEWNTYEITCRGKNITVWINGAVTCEMKDCEVPAGHIGMQAEYFFIEFKNLKFKSMR
jgi:hypothetical protein